MYLKVKFRLKQNRFNNRESFYNLNKLSKLINYAFFSSINPVVYKTTRFFLNLTPALNEMKQFPINKSASDNN